MNYICCSGNFDEINDPTNISDYSKETICFLMFVDEEIESNLRSSARLGTRKKIGLWRIIVSHNLPYTAPRGTGKVRIICKLAPSRN